LGPGHGAGFESVGVRRSQNPSCGTVECWVPRAPDRLGRCDASAVLLEIGRYKAIPSENQSRFLFKSTRHTLSHSCATFQGWRRWSRGLNPAPRRQTATGVRYLPTSGHLRGPAATRFVRKRIHRGKFSIVDAD
jgi:hypothetical protein